MMPPSTRPNIDLSSDGERFDRRRSSAIKMKIFKYRDFSNPNDEDFRRLEGSVHRHLIWCARADTLNDPEEFVWSCDYTATPSTLDLLAKVLVRERGGTLADARRIADVAIRAGRLEIVSKPATTGIIEQCRAQVGLCCFGTAPDNKILWKRYGGNGAGVCIEFEVPDDLLGTQLHRVHYFRKKRLHIDQLLRAFVEKGHVQRVYDLTLLAKPSRWAREKEIRFVSKSHSIQVAIDRAQVTCVYLGDLLTPDAREKIQRIFAPVPLADRLMPLVRALRRPKRRK
jgi:hypothetical protein